MVDAKEYWNQFYQKNENTNPEVNYFLKDMLPRLQKGLVLDVAMGVGQNSIYLAENGFAVKGFDISNTAVSLAKETAITKKLDIDAQVLDLDFFMMQPMEYDSIIMTRFKPSLVRFFPEMIRGIKQGGTILIESVSVESMERALSSHESHLDHYYKVNEILKHMSGLLILFYQETMINGTNVVQCLAKKPIDKDAIKYDFLNMHSKSDKPHPISRQMELAEQLFKK